MGDGVRCRPLSPSRAGAALCKGPVQTCFRTRLGTMRTIPVTEAKARLNELIEDAEATHEQVTITRHGHPAVVLVAVDDFEALKETVFWLSQPGLRESLAESTADMAADAGISSDELRSRLNLPAR